jgi:hypothetical protein
MKKLSSWDSVNATFYGLGEALKDKEFETI